MQFLSGPCSRLHLLVILWGYSVNVRLTYKNSYVYSLSGDTENARKENARQERAQNAGGMQDWKMKDKLHFLSCIF